jgi:hypothetical protein
MRYVIRVLAAMALLVGTAASGHEAEAPHAGLSGCLEVGEQRLCYTTQHVPRVLASPPRCAVSAQITDAAGVTLGALAEDAMPAAWRAPGEHTPLTARQAARLSLAVAAVAAPPELSRDRHLLMAVAATLERGVAQAAAMPLAGQARAAESSWAHPLNSLGGAQGVSRARVFRAWRGGREYTQTLELWSQPCVEGRGDHSGTVAHLLTRRLGSQDPWTLDRSVTSCNHGTCPGDGDMRQYDRCEPAVVTEEWHMVGGECAGWWGFEHVCNDDTALQINNAFGRYSDDRCQGQRRLRRPACAAQW